VIELINRITFSTRKTLVSRKSRPT